MDTDAERNWLLKPSHDSNKVRLCVSFRLLIALLCNLALVLCFAHQSSMGSTMVCMTASVHGNDNHTDIIDNVTSVPDSDGFVGTGGEEGEGGGAADSTVPPSSSSSSSDRASQLPPYRYDWDKTTQGWIHSSLFVGYYVVLLPSGFLATRYGGKRVIVWGLLASSVAQLLTPWAASMGVVWLCVVRALCGFATGFIYAPVFAVLANWVPSDECSLLFGIGASGVELGAMVTFLASGVACEMDVIGGWPLVYYFIGCLGLLVALVFYTLASDIPSQNRWMSKRECQYIETLIGQAGGHGHKDQIDNAPLSSNIPIRSIMTSLPVWAILVSQIGSDWLFYLMITVMPNFMEEVMQMSNTTISLVISVPFLGIITTTYIAGSVCDLLRKKEIATTITIRKLSDFICKIVPGGLLVTLGFLGPDDLALFIGLYLLACMLLAFMYMSWVVNPVDLAPAYTGFITSISETGAMWIAMVVPVLVENMTKQKTAEEWRVVMYISGGIQVVTFLFYFIFGSSELQPWSRPNTDTSVNVRVRHSTSTDRITLETGPPVNPGKGNPFPSYRSLSVAGQRMTNGPVSSFHSDTEDSRHSQRHVKVSYHSDKTRANGHACSTIPHQQTTNTGNIEPDYVTMGWHDASGGLTDIEETSYESMNFDVGQRHRLTKSHRASEEDEPIYENVTLESPDTEPSSPKLKS